MDMDLDRSARQSSTTRSTNGCWTCRLRRKKCDKTHPVCDACTALCITCYSSEDKPDWMDGGVRQDEMAEKLKSEVKEHRRRGERARNSAAAAESTELSPNEKVPADLTASRYDLVNTSTSIYDGKDVRPEAPTIQLQRGADSSHICQDAGESITFGRSDTVLFLFYLEHLLPFLFPFYRPSVLQGGRAWILEMMISSPVVRNATLCQSSYFFSLVQGLANSKVMCEMIVTQTRYAFEALRQSLQVISSSDITEHLHGAVRILASIMQVQRFETAVLNGNNCASHLSAALALFKQLVDNPGTVDSTGHNASFNALISRLGPPSWITNAQSVQIPSAEHAAFRFSSAFLLLDDIIASTALQEEPRLYEYHRSLLDGPDPPINLAAVVGCQNWALLLIGEIAVLDAWKQRCKRAGNLDVMELVRRATAIKDALEAHLTRLESEPVIVPRECGSDLIDILTSGYNQQSQPPTFETAVVTRVWAHAALVYLCVVVSGWQPASVDVRHHVGRIIELLATQIPRALLRTMVWPFCVAGCLAEPAQEPLLRGLVEVLQPPSVFRTVRKAFGIMESVWRERNMGDISTRDLATCFRSQGELVLLV